MLLRIYSRIQTALINEEGATAVEYGIMVALIAGAIVLIVETVGTQLAQTFTTVSGFLP